MPNSLVSLFTHSLFEHFKIKPDNALKYVIDQKKSQNNIAELANSKIQEIPLGEDQVRQGKVVDADSCIITKEELQCSLLNSEKEILEGLDHFESLEAKINIGKYLLADGYLTQNASFSSQPDTNAYLSIWDSFFNHFAASLEGQNSSNERQVVQNLASGIKRIKSNKKLIDKIKTSPNQLPLFADQFARKVHDLKPGQSELFHGIWTKKSGNKGDVIVEFARKDGSLFDILIYDASPNTFNGIIDNGDKQRLVPLVRYSSVPEKAFLFSGDGTVRSSFFKNFLYSITYEKPNYLEHSLRYIAEYLDPVKPEEYGLITPCRKAAFSVSSIKSWIRRHSGSLAFYKQTMFHFKLKALQQFYFMLEKHIAKDSENAAQARQFLKHQAAKILLRIPKHCANQGYDSLISKETALQARATAHDVKARVNAIEESIRQKRSQKTVSQKIETEESFADFRLLDSSPHAKLSSNSSPLDHTYNIDLSLHIDAEVPSSVLPALEATLKRLSQAGLNGAMACAQIHHIVDQIPLVDSNGLMPPLWFRAELKELQDIQRSLLSIFSEYTKFYAQDTLERRYATVYPLYSAIYAIALEIDRRMRGELDDDEAKLSNYGIPDLSMVLEQEGLLFFNRKEFYRIIEADRFIKSCNKDKDDQLFKAVYHYINNNEVEFDLERDTDVNETTITKYPENAKYWKALLRTDSNLLSIVKEKGNSRFKDLTEDEIRKNFEAMVDAKNRWLKGVENHNAYLVKLEEYNKAYAEWRNTRNGTAPVKPVKVEHPGSKPPDPKREVNLPQETKQLLMMQEMSAEHPLEKSGNDHVAHLRKALCHLAAFSVAEPKKFVVENRAERVDRYTAEAQVRNEFAMAGSGGKKTFLNLALEKHRAVNQNYAQFLSNNKPTTRSEREWKKETAEGSALVEYRENPEDLAAKLLRVLSNWQLAPNQILFELQKNLPLLNNNSLQSLIYRIFFRSPVTTSREIKLGVGDLICEDMALRENAYAFINKGIKYFLGVNYDIEGARFFIELSYFLAKYLSDAGMHSEAEKFDQSLMIDQALQKNLKPSEKAELYYFKILQYAARPELEYDDTVKVYQYWLNYHFFRNAASAQTMTVLDNILETFFLNLTHKVFSDAAIDKGRLGKDIVKGLSIDQNAQSGQWLVDERRKAPYLSNGEWQINLFKGILYRNGSSLCGSFNGFSWEKTEQFIKIFGQESSYEYIAEGNAYYFSDPKMGRFRIVQDGGETYIQKQFFVDDEWLWFQCDNKPQAAYYPSDLLKKCILWRPADNDSYVAQGELYRGFFTAVHDFRINYVLDNKGGIAQSYRGLPISDKNGYVVDVLQKERWVQDFDHYIHTKTFSKDGYLEKFAFTRYKSVDGNQLMFEFHNGDPVWTENREYRLASSKPLGLLGTIDNYLYLEHRKKSVEPSLLIVPFQTIDYSKDGRVSSPYTGPSIATNWKVDRGDETYFVYGCDNGRLVPHSLEGRLFLAYVYLSQQKYSEAAALLKSVSLSESISEIGLEVLRNILLYNLCEDVPDAVMVSLHAFMLIVRQKDAASDRVVGDYLKPDPNAVHFSTLMVNYNIFIDRQNSVSDICKMSVDDEIRLLEAMIKSVPSSIASNSMERVPLNYTLIFERLKRRLKFLKSGDAPRAYNYNNLDYTGKLSTDDARWAPKRLSKPAKPVRVKGTSDEDYNKILEAYKNRLKDYHEKLYASIDWFIKGYKADGKIVLNPFDYPGFEKNGRLFLHVYSVAKSKNQDAINELIYLLETWQRHASEIGLIGFEKTYLDSLLALLTRPEDFPELIQINPDDLDAAASEKVIDFLEEFDESYSRCGGGYGKLQYPKGPVVVRSEKNEFMELPQRDSFVQNKRGGWENQKPKFPPSIQQDRWKTLDSWKSYIQEQDSSSAEAFSDFTYKVKAKSLSPIEKVHKKTIDNDLRKLKEDYHKGKEKNLKDKLKNIDPDDCKILAEKAQAELAKVQAAKNAKEAELLRKLNISSADSMLKQANLAKLGVEGNGLLTLQNSLSALLEFNYKAYHDANKNILEPGQVDNIASLTLEIEDLKSYSAQLERILSLSREITALDAQAKADNVNSPIRRSLCYRLDAEISSRYHFEGLDEEMSAIMRIYAGESGIIPHEKQILLIKEMLRLNESDPSRYRDIIIQLIMGGGKTSVIATILLYVGAKRQDRLAFFIVPPSLFDTVSGNLSESMLKAFSKDILTIKLERDQFTNYNLKKTYELLEKAKKEKLPVVVNASTLQGFELELISAACKIRDLLNKQKALKEKIDSAKHPALIENLKCALNSTEGEISSLYNLGVQLSKIINYTRKHADALLDEVDILLDIFQEVNYVDGEKVKVEPERCNLLLEVHKIFNSADILVPTLDNQPIKDILRLKSNQQSLLSENDYLQHVAPVVAKELLNKFRLFKNKISDRYSDSFVRYVSGQMPAILSDMVKRSKQINKDYFQDNLKKFGNLTYSQAEMDLAFLNHLSNSSGIKKDKELADFTALAKHFVSELAPSTLSKVSGRHYGLSNNKNTPGKIVPYLGVHTPASTEFGYHWELAFYYYQLGVTEKPSKEQILLIARSAESASRYYMEKNGEKFEETAEYLDFKKLFGIGLEEVTDEKRLEYAIEYISGNPVKRLKMQDEVISIYGSYAQRRLSSDGFCLLDLLSSFRAMSGTPWNMEGFDKRLAEFFLLDIGTEGRFFEKLAQRAASKTDRYGNKNEGVYEVDFRENDFANPFTLKEFLNKIYDTHDDPAQIQGIIEAEGLFKTFGSNLEVAQGWMAFIEERQKAEEPLAAADPGFKRTVDPAIEGVLFFHNDPGQSQPNTLYVWKKGAAAPERIGKTTVDALKAKGLDPHNCLVYFDERRTTGTDIKMKSASRCLYTYGPNQLYRTAGQSIARQRENLLEQSVDIIITSESRKKVYNEGKTLDDFVTNAAKVQSVRKSQAMIRFFTGQINHLFRRYSAFRISSLFDNSGDFDFGKTVTKLEKYVVKEYHEDPWKQFGHLSDIVNTKEMLISYLEHLHAKSHEDFSDDPFRHQINNDVEDLKKWIMDATCLPEEWKDIMSQFQSGFEVQNEVATQVEQEVQLQIEEEIEEELHQYTSKGLSALRLENEMTEERFLGLLNNLRNGQPDCDIIPLQKQLADVKSHTFKGRKMPYENVFKQSICGTHAYFHLFANDEKLSVFNPLHRPAKQILAVKDKTGQFKWLLLSEREAGDVKNHLEKQYKDTELEDVWLIQPDGSLLAAGQGMSVLDAGLQGFIDGLIELNVLNGGIDFLNLDKFVFDFEDWLNSSPKDKEIRIRFLKLRVAKDPIKKAIFSSCRPIIEASGNEVKNVSATLFKSKTRIEWEKNRLGSYDPSKEWDNKEDFWKVKLLDPQKLRFGYRDLKVEFVKYIGIEWASDDPLNKMALEELKKVYPSQQELNKQITRLNKAQYENLSHFHVPHLSPSQIMHLPLNKVKFIQYPTQIYSEKDGKATYYLTREQAKWLTDEQADLIPYINPEFYNDFTEKWQFQKIPLHYLDKIDCSRVAFLGREQTNYLFAQSLLGNADAKIRVDHFLPNQWSFINGDLIESIPSKFRHQITQEQISQITDHQLIAKLEEIAKESTEDYVEGTWTSWIAPEMVKHITENQVKYLHTKEQIKNIKDDFAASLSLEQIKFIQPQHVKHLREPKKIQACPNDLVRKLDSEQVKSILAEQVPHLRGVKQIKALDKELVKYLKPATEPKNGCVNQIRWLQDSQLELIKENQVKGLTHAQIRKIARLESAWKNLRKHLSKGQIESFDSEDLISTAPKSLLRSYLLQKHVHLLTQPRNIKACPAELVKHLTVDQLQHIDKSQAVHIEGKAQVEALPDAYLDELKDVHFDHITERQAGLLSLDQIQSLRGEKQLSKLPLEKLSLIRPSQAGYVRGAERIQSIPCTKVHVFYFDKCQLKDITTEQARLLTPRQIERMDTAQEIEKLEMDQWLYLGKIGIEILGDKITELLKNEELVKRPEIKDIIRYIGPHLIHLLDKPELVKHLKDEQIYHFGADGFNRLDKKHPLWKRVHKNLLDGITTAKLASIPKDRLKHIKNENTIKQVPLRDYVHLEKRQLKNISPGWSLVYTIGVFTLGVAACLVSLVAYLTIYPLCKAISKQKGNRIYRALVPNLIRPIHYFKAFKKAERDN